MAVPQRHREEAVPICLRCGEVTRQTEVVTADGSRVGTTRCPRCAGHQDDRAGPRP